MSSPDCNGPTGTPGGSCTTTQRGKQTSRPNKEISLTSWDQIAKSQEADTAFKDFSVVPVSTQVMMKNNIFTLRNTSYFPLKYVLPSMLCWFSVVLEHKKISILPQGYKHRTEPRCSMFAGWRKENRSGRNWSK